MELTKQDLIDLQLAGVTVSVEVSIFGGTVPETDPGPTPDPNKPPCKQVIVTKDDLLLVRAHPDYPQPKYKPVPQGTGIHVNDGTIWEVEDVKIMFDGGTHYYRIWRGVNDNTEYRGLYLKCEHVRDRH